MALAQSRKQQTLIQFVLILGILLACNVGSKFLYGYLDLTEEKRFTLTQPTKKLIGGLKDVVHVEILLEGQFPAGFKRLRESLKETLDDMHDVGPFVEYSFRDPLQGKAEDVKKTQETLRTQGILPVNLRIVDNDERSEKLIYPYAIVHYGNREVAVNLLESETPGLPKEVILNNSVSLLEYKITNAIQKLLANTKPLVGFLQGHGELGAGATTDIRKSLAQFYEVGPVFLDSLAAIPPSKIPVLIVAKPRGLFNDKDLFKIDQYLMQGGRIIWCIDRLSASLDSMQGQRKMVPYEYVLGLDDLFFRNGVRIQSDLVLDIECARIPLAVGQQGGAPQFENFPWLYFPVPAARSNHPVVKNLDRVWFQFPSSIDTLKTKTDIRKTVLLSSSQYSRLQFVPMEVDLNLAGLAPDPKQFKKSFIPLAVLLEGTFSSMFENRVTPEMEAGLKTLGQPFQAQSSKKGKMIIIADGDIVRNDFRSDDNTFSPTGFSRYDKYMYANKDFILNAIEYLVDESGVIEARTKDVKLRLLDPGKVKTQKLQLQLINMLGPLVLLGLLAALVLWWRKRRFSRF